MVIEHMTQEYDKETNGVRGHKQKERAMERGVCRSSTRKKYYKNTKMQRVTFYSFLILKNQNG